MPATLIPPDHSNLGNERGQQINVVSNHVPKVFEPEGYWGGNHMSFVTTQPEALAAAIHEMFVNTLGISSGSYAATEAANAIAAG
jgi:hypothetical protein